MASVVSAIVAAVVSIFLGALVGFLFDSQPTTSAIGAGIVLIGLSLLFVTYQSAVRLIEKHLAHIGIAYLLIIRDPDIAKKAPAEIMKAAKEMRKALNDIWRQLR